jgi:hypothetical protein
LLRIIELSMPMHFRVLLENCDNSKAFFGLLGAGEEMKFHRVNFSEDKKEILKEMKSKIKNAKEQYNTYICPHQEFMRKYIGHGCSSNGMERNHRK